MALTISSAAASAACDAVLALVDGGTGAGTLSIYSGTRAADPGTSPAGDLLAQFTLDDPAFASASSGAASLDVDPALTDTGITDGTAAWFRFADSDGNGVVDGTVTATSGGGDLELNTVTISTGVNVEVTGGTITMPDGT